MSDQERLAGYVEVWWQAVEDFTALLAELPDEQWSTPTDLAGWDVRAVAAHTAHLEAILAGGPEETAEVPELPHITGLMGTYTEIGVITRRDTAPRAIVEEIRTAAAARYRALTENPPTDGSARPEVIFGGVPWSWETLLRNRPLDVWMHEQDVRRAVGRPGGVETPAAQHTTDYLMESFGYVLAKKAQSPAGTTAVLRVQGSEPMAFAVDENGRGRRLEQLPESPAVELATDRETFVVLAGGRRHAEPGAVQVTGDQQLGERLVGLLATTP